MLNDKKIEEADVKYANYLKGICDFTIINASEEGFKAGAKWAINELLKDCGIMLAKNPRKIILSYLKLLAIVLKRNILAKMTGLPSLDVLRLLSGSMLMICFQRKEVINERA